jgi:hypothetical protein
MFIVVATLVLGGTFLSRLLPRLVLPDALSSDSYFHLGMARAIREHGHRIPDMMPRVLVCARFRYPYLFHWLLSFVPERHLLPAERLASPVIETIYTAGVLFFALSILRIGGLSPDPEGTALWIAAIFSLSPALVGVGGGPRAYNGTPRTLGQCLFFFFAASAVMYAQAGALPWAVVAVAAAAALSVTSKFGNQTVVAICIGLLALGFVAPVVLALCGYAVAAAVTKGRALQVLRGQLAHSMFYARYLQQRFLHKGRVKFGDYAARARGMVRAGARGKIVALVRWFFSEPFFLHKFIVGSPQLVLLALAVAGGLGEQASAALRSPALALPLAFIATSVAASLLVSLRPLAFLGEAERYAEHTVFFQILAFAVVAEAAGLAWLKGVLLAYSALAYVVSVRTYIERNAHAVGLRQRMAALVAPIDRDGTRIFWLGHLFWPLWFSTRKASILVHGANFDERQLDKDRWFEVFGNLPYPGVPIDQVVGRYKLDYVVATPDFVAHYESLLGDRAFSEGRFSEMARTGDLVLYRPAGAPA